MLRHARGFALANQGHDTRALQATSATATSSTRCDTPNCRRAGSRTSDADLNLDLRELDARRPAFIRIHVRFVTLV